MRRAGLAGLSVAAAALIAAVVAVSTSCSQTPTNIPVRTFQQAQKMDIVCIAVNDVNGNALPGNQLTALPADDCSPQVSGAINNQNHLYASVTQTTPGTLALVDLTGGYVVDEDKATPGINFIPVGANPTDVATSPDGAMTYVSSGDINKPAIYGMDSRRLLGDAAGNPPLPPLQLTDIPACALPQPPDAMLAVPTAGGGYVLIVMLRGGVGGPAQIAAIDPRPLMRGMKVGDAGTGPVDEPGTLSACTALDATKLLGTLPASFSAGPYWPDGVPYVDGGVNLDGAEPPPVPSVPAGGVAAACPLGGQALPDASIALAVGPLQDPSPSAMVLRTDKPILYVADGALPIIHVLDVSDPSKLTEDTSRDLLAVSTRDPFKRVSVGPMAISPPTRDYKTYLYAVDESDGTLMVFDVTDPLTSPRTPLQRPHAELNPFYPVDRLSFAAPVASVAFVGHDWLVPSMAQGSSPTNWHSGVLCNPNPAAHPDTNDFLAAGAYYRADQAGTIQNSGTVLNLPGRLRGVFGFVTLSNGSVVPIDVDDWDAPCRRPDPMTDQPQVSDPIKTNGTYSNKVEIGHGWQTGLLDVPQPAPSGPKDLGEYHVPLAYQGALSESAAVTLESFFPVSAPHRIRSNFLLVNDPSSGNHSPNVLSPPQFFDQNGSPVQVNNGASSVMFPTQLPTGFTDPSQVSNPTEPNPNNQTPLSGAPGGGVPEGGAVEGGTGLDGGVVPGVRVSFDDPTAQFNQDWTLTYEGVLPGTPNVEADIVSTDGYQSLILTTGTISTPKDAGSTGLTGPGFCALGVEDWTLGIARREGTGDKSQAPAENWTADYVEFADDLLGQSDPYWSQPFKDKSGNVVNDCWEGTELSNDGDSNIAAARYNACSTVFGASGTAASTSGYGTNADSYPARDFPIIHAFDDHLQLGRFGWTQKVEDPSNRVVVGPNNSGDQALFLRMARCCFHHQATFKVRTGGEWALVGQNGLGFLNHVRVGPGGACVLSCDPDDALLNARVLDTSVTEKAQDKSCFIAPPTTGALSRNDPSALRNPMFSFYVQQPFGAVPDCTTHTLDVRDSQWRFSMGGGFNPIVISLTQGSAGGVSPQSMRFIEPFGQLAVVDGAQQGLVLIDLNTLSFAHSPYY